MKPKKFLKPKDGIRLQSALLLVGISFVSILSPNVPPVGDEWYQVLLLTPDGTTSKFAFTETVAQLSANIISIPNADRCDVKLYRQFFSIGFGNDLTLFSVY